MHFISTCTSIAFYPISHTPRLVPTLQSSPKFAELMPSKHRRKRPKVRPDTRHHGQNTPSPMPRSSRLLSLPPEIREQILAYVVSSPDTPIEVKFGKKVFLGGPSLHQCRQHLAVLRTCRTLHAEGFPIFLRHNVFIIFTSSSETSLERAKCYAKPGTMCFGHDQDCIGANFANSIGGFGEHNESTSCERNIPTSNLRHLRHVMIVLQDGMYIEWRTFREIGLFLETLADQRARLSTLLMITETLSPFEDESVSFSAMNSMRPLLPALKYLVNKSHPRRVQFCSFIPSFHHGNINLSGDVAFRIRHHLLKEREVEARTSPTPSQCETSNAGLFASAVCANSNHWLSHDGISLYIFDSMLENDRGLIDYENSSLKSKFQWQSFSNPFFRWKSQRACLSAPQKGFLDDEDIAAFGFMDEDRV